MKQQARKPPFELTTNRQGSRFFIALVGELDLTARASFDQMLLEQLREPIRDVAVDLSGLTYMDSTGLFLVIELWRRCSEAGITVGFEGGSGQIHDLLGFTGVDRVLSHYAQPAHRNAH
jgi:anti-sigma B factor antagonist